MTVHEVAKTFDRREVDSVEIDLPMPPSVNALFANKPGKGRIKTKAYKAWLEEAGLILNCQRPGRIAGRYSIHIQVRRLPKMSDLANREKATSDLLVKHGVIEDDSLAERVMIEWSDSILGARVFVERAA